MPDHAHSRLLAKLMRDVLRADDFGTLADLVDAIKTRCARLGIRWTNDELNQALAVIASNRSLTRDAPLASPHPIPEAPPNPTLSRTEAAQICDRLLAKYAQDR